MSEYQPDAPVCREEFDALSERVKRIECALATLNAPRPIAITTCEGEKNPHDAMSWGWSHD